MSGLTALYQHSDANQYFPLLDASEACFLHTVYIKLRSCLVHESTAFKKIDTFKTLLTYFKAI